MPRSRSVVFAAGLAIFAGAPCAYAAINISLLSTSSSVNINTSFTADIWATPSSGGSEGLLSYQVIFGWQPSFVRLDGFSNSGGLSYTALGFLNDPYGLNRVPTITTPPSDGDAILIGLGPIGSSIVIPPSGLKLCTLQFTALAPSNYSPIDVFASAGSPVGTTVVYGAGGPNIDVTGTLHGSGIQIVPSPGTLIAFVAFPLSIRRKRRTN